MGYGHDHRRGIFAELLVNFCKGDGYKMAWHGKGPDSFAKNENDNKYLTLKIDAQGTLVLGHDSLKVGQGGLAAIETLFV